MSVPLKVFTSSVKSAGMIEPVTLMLLPCGLDSLYPAVAKVDIFIQVLAASLLVGVLLADTYQNALYR